MDQKVILRFVETLYLIYQGAVLFVWTLPITMNDYITGLREKVVLFWHWNTRKHQVSFLYRLLLSNCNAHNTTKAEYSISLCS